jgi:hypothetical protein
LLSKAQLLGQETTASENKNVLTMALAYTFISAGSAQDNLENGHFVPGIGIDYFRRIHPKFDVGIMADIELGTYIIPRQDDLIRERALVLALIGSYALTENWGVFFGPGYELERHKSFPIFRLGSEYIFTLNSDWFVPVGLFYDIKEGFDAWSVSAGIGFNF